LEFDYEVYKSKLRVDYIFVKEFIQPKSEYVKEINFTEAKKESFAKAIIEKLK
jgi:hypothetical protein